jgi:hypothetical protein
MFDFIMKEIYGKKLWQCEAICENLEATWKELKYRKCKNRYYACHIVAIVVVST